MEEETLEQVFELRTSVMFPINNQAAFTKQDKLEFISIALQTERQFNNSYKVAAALGKDPLMQIYGFSDYPFICVSRGCKFADSFSPNYFLKTFPTYFPFSRNRL